MLLPVAGFLTYPEAVALYHELLAADLVALVKTHGPPSLPYGEGMYYQLLLAEEQHEAAQPILAGFEQARRASPPLRCPRCRSLAVAPLTPVSWWRRVLYTGTTPYQCATCRRVFAG